MSVIVCEVATSETDISMAYDLYTTAFEAKNIPHGNFEHFSSGNVIVAKLDGLIVGFRKFRIVENVVQEQGTYIDPAYRGQGIGTAMIEWCHIHYRSLGATAIDVKIQATDTDLNQFRVTSPDYTFMGAQDGPGGPFNVYRRML